MTDNECKSKYEIHGTRNRVKGMKNLVKQMLKKEILVDSRIDVDEEEFNRLLKMTHYFD